MSGNTLGTLFTVTTLGESHGPAIGCVIDGCPPGMELSERRKDYAKIATSFRPGHADYARLAKYGIRN